MSPTVPDDFHYSGTRRLLTSSSRDESSDAVPSYLFDTELDDETIGRALSSPLFIQEREEPADRREAYHSFEESLLPTQSFFAHSRTVRPVHELSSLSSCREKPNEQIKILLERQKEQILADVRAEIHIHKFQADFHRKSIQELTVSSLNEEKLITPLHVMNNVDEINNFMNNYQNKIGIFVKLIWKVFMRWMNWRESQDLNLREEDWSKIETFLKFTAKIQELQNEVVCMNDSRDFKDAESSTQCTIPRYQSTSVFPTFSRSLRNAKPFCGNAEPATMGPPDVWDTHGKSGNVFVNPTASSSAHYPEGFNPWNSNVPEHTSAHVMSESQTPNTQFKIRDASQDRQPEIHSTLVREVFQRIMEQTHKRLQISDLHFDKFSTPSNVCLLEDKVQDWGMYLLTISYGRYAVDRRRGDGRIGGWSQIFAFFQKNSRTRFWGTRRKIDCFSKKKISLEEQKAQKRTASSEEDRSLTWSTSTSGSLELMILSRIMRTYLQLFFEMMIFRNSIQNGTKFYDLWRKSHLMTFLEGLYKLRIWGSEKLKSVLELYDLETHQKKLGPDYHRLKTMVKRSIEQDLRNRNFGARNGNNERNAVVKNQGTKQRVQRILGDCWQRKANRPVF